MVDFGGNVRAGRTLYDLLNKYFRPGDIFTHMYGGHRGEQDPETKGPSKAMLDGRKRGVIFDVGHGGGSFLWSCAIPLMKAGFIPDSISTDLHYSSANAGMKDMLNVMDKFLAMGMSLDEVISGRPKPAKEIQHEELRNLGEAARRRFCIPIEKGVCGTRPAANCPVPRSCSVR
jgi:dihydroorotase